MVARPRNYLPWTSLLVAVCVVGCPARKDRDETESFRVIADDAAPDDAALPAAPEREPAETPPRPSRRCIADPVKHATRLFGAPPEATQAFPDIDGDGSRESYAVGVTRDDAGAVDRVLLMYVSGRGCRRFVGRFPGVMVRALATEHQRLRDLSTWAGGGCRGLDGNLTVYEFDGGQYREAAMVTCGCPTEGERRADRDPRCPRLRGGKLRFGE